MKNLLLASTALVAFAGAAVAEVTVSGQGRFGVVASNGEDGRFERDNTGGDIVYIEDGAEVAFSSRLRVIFNMSFESDTGLTFGGTTRADNAGGANKGTAGSVFVSGDFGKLQVGDTDSAAQAAVGDISGVGYTGIGDYNETFYLLGGGGDPLADDRTSAAALPTALYSYSTGGATFFVSIGNPAGVGFDLNQDVELSNGTIIEGVDREGELNSQYAVGVQWANDQFSVGAGYESVKAEYLPQEVQDENGDYYYIDRDSDTLGAFYLGGSATFGGATVKAMYGDITDLDYSQYGMSVDYTFDAWTATAFFRTADYGDRTLDGEELGSRTAYGLGAAYDLGGGVAVKAGVVDPDLPGTYWQADAGITFNF